MRGRITSIELKLSQALVAWLYDEMVSHLADQSRAPGALHDFGQSNYEFGCSALARAGVLKRDGQYWRIVKPPMTHFEFPRDFARVDLDHFLDGFACHYFFVAGSLQQYEPFTPKGSTLRDVCRALVDCGYMVTDSDGLFEWTDKFGPWLVRHDAWSLDDFERASEQEIDAAILRIPREATERLSDRMCRYPPNFVRCFFAHWIEGNWHEESWREAPSDDWDLSLAAGLYQRLQRG